MNNLYETALQSLKFMDLTQLNEEDTPQDIMLLCQRAKTDFGQTAAICIYPFFIPMAKKQLQRQKTPDINIVTVVNFPSGDSSANQVSKEIEHAILHGADEIDVVFPYKALIAGDENAGSELIKQCKAACGNKLMKVILETGELKSQKLIRKATQISINAGADMIKTSTGKVAVNSTLKAAETIMTEIKTMGAAQSIGFKASGGIETLEQAYAYLDLASNIMGADYLEKKLFRIGASRLLSNLLQTLNKVAPPEEISVYKL